MPSSTPPTTGGVVSLTSVAPGADLSRAARMGSISRSPPLNRPPTSTTSNCSCSISSWRATPAARSARLSPAQRITSQATASPFSAVLKINGAARPRISKRSWVRPSISSAAVFTPTSSQNTSVKWVTGPRRDQARETRRTASPTSSPAPAPSPIGKPMPVTLPYLCWRLRPQQLQPEPATTAR
ncbi:MAG: hypothetical protein ABSE06_13770, partial [Anaerolineaceae bacterium]